METLQCFKDKQQNLAMLKMFFMLTLSLSNDATQVFQQSCENRDYFKKKKKFKKIFPVVSSRPSTSILIFEKLRA